MKLIDCDLEHSAAIMAIFNDAILNSTALYEYRPRTEAVIEEWFAAKRRGGYPVIGVVDDEDRLMGFASYGAFRAFPAYKYTVEHSLYIDAQFRGQGLGRLLLESLIQRARDNDLHCMVGGIDSQNVASIKLHEKMGFAHCATMPQVGYKFGRWLDLCFYQLILETPSEPRDG